MSASSGFLSNLRRFRRGKVGSTAVIAFGLLVAGSLFTVLAPTSTAEKGSDAATIAQGKALFLVGCASCHGKNAEGVQTQNGGNYGPSLVGVGAAAVDFQVESGRMPMAQSGPQAPVKKRVYNEEETEALAAYVASLAPGPAVPSEEQYSLPEDLDDEERAEAIAEGGEFFRSNCTACHNFAGAGGALPQGKYAPSLSGVSKEHLYEAMLTGPQQMPVFSDEVLTPEDKAKVIAYVKAIQSTDVEEDGVPNYGGFGMGSLGPVADGLFAWLSLGILVIFAVWIAAHSTRAKKDKA